MLQSFLSGNAAEKEAARDPLRSNPFGADVPECAPFRNSDHRILGALGVVGYFLLGAGGAALGEGDAPCLTVTGPSIATDPVTGIAM